MLGSKFHVIYSLQYNTNINTVEVDHHPDSLDGALYCSSKHFLIMAIKTNVRKRQKLASIVLAIIRVQKLTQVSIINYNLVNELNYLNIKHVPTLIPLSNDIILFDCFTLKALNGNFVYIFIFSTKFRSVYFEFYISFYMSSLWIKLQCK